MSPHELTRLTVVIPVVASGLVCAAAGMLFSLSGSGVLLTLIATACCAWIAVSWNEVRQRVHHDDLRSSLERRFGETREIEAFERRLLEQVIGTAGAPIVATDGRGSVERLNEAASVMFQLNGAVGRPIDEVFPQAGILDLHARALKGERAHGRVRAVVGQDRRVLDVDAAPLERGVVLCIRDVTELARALDLKTDFVANVSHELRTPLASIRAAVETLEGDVEGKAGRRLIHIIESNVARIEELIRDLLDLSRLESPERPLRMRQVTMERLNAVLLDQFQLVCVERDIKLIFDTTLSQVETDEALLVIILRNLIENAIKFTRDGTSVRVQVREAGGVVEWRVRDHGPGIPIEDQERVFERFYQVDPARTGHPSTRGTGLGLAIVKHAVRQFGGTVRVESVWGEGTTMVVQLPVPSNA